MSKVFILDEGVSLTHKRADCGYFHILIEIDGEVEMSFHHIEDERVAASEAFTRAMEFVACSTTANPHMN